MTGVDAITAEHVDEVLATTRAVRRRLDLDRPVDNQLLLDCIDLAEQAPTGGNLGSRRWIIVRDQGVKDQLGELYRKTALPFMAAAAERLAGTGHRNERVMASAAYLAEHLAEVPAIVIPTIIGRHDGSSRPGLFDSVIQAAWSFCLALRARGLGTTWVTAALQDEATVKEILGIPDHMTEVVLFPVAWTKGTDFGRAPRHPARAITYFDRFGTTFETGPGDDAALRRRPRRWSPRSTSTRRRRRSGHSSPTSTCRPGSPASSSAPSGKATSAAWAPSSTAATTTKRSASGRSRASSTPTTNRAPFGWRTSDPDTPGARWRFDLEPLDGGTRLRFSYTIGPGPSGTSMAIANHPGKEARVLRRRLDEVHANMQRDRRGRQAARRSNAGDPAGRHRGDAL